ncbi:hypothetical protein I7I50_09631 [Histoplasma capsulatum G186AR]|uniref:Uncharacterized protein n=1 Tax=Ajellomyces capsulatus TaxID=5037 RepID=A0A8H8D0E7_AJECA|nr:hypothetical protein I7I52_07161 [Histoplasma capsulatum]QSS74447.1 hypothetical protein I7I50_09631 [Histoplasma capsulatum G186AR]
MGYILPCLPGDICCGLISVIRLPSARKIGISEASLPMSLRRLTVALDLVRFILFMKSALSASSLMFWPIKRYSIGCCFSGSFNSFTSRERRPRSLMLNSP